MDANLYTLLERHFPEERSQPCAMVPGGPAVSYGEIERLAARIAHALVAAGCRPGDRVAVQVDKHWQVLALYLATLRAGLVYLPLNTAYQRAELEYFFADAEPRVIVCGDAMLGVIATLAKGATVLTLDAHGGEIAGRAASMPANFATVARAPDDLAAILYTSGTTGRAKGAMLTHRNLASNALALVEAWQFSRHDVLLHALPIYHVHGLFVAVHCVLLAGARMIWLPRFEAHEVATLLPKASVMMGVPTFYTRLLAEPALTRQAAAGVRLFVSGSAPLLAETFRAFEARTGHRILERYGLTETGMNTSNPYAGARVAGTVGPPLPGVELRIVDRAGAPCASGAVGAIEVRGPNVCRGYWRMPDKTRESIDCDGWFRTGDLGQWSSDGYVTITGRAKDLIISGGLNIYPKEIEERIDALDGVAESAVIGIADPDFGEVVVAVVVTKHGHALTEASIIDALRGEIAHFKVPKRVVFAAELPRNAMGKVQKNALRASFAAAAG
ncbi:MAG TPA: malonyl-CoA synthase [Casimicrobiaceae bacterium]|jgi:malonyl-CoA/methylmalonyl-CoA synthetase|nr:malonyl-CoA synthase [Casimicrobiaceae bacterium]